MVMIDIRNYVAYLGGHKDSTRIATAARFPSVRCYLRNGLPVKFTQNSFELFCHAIQITCATFALILFTTQNSFCGSQEIFTTCLLPPLFNIWDYKVYLCKPSSLESNDRTNQIGHESRIKNLIMKILGDILERKKCGHVCPKAHGCPLKNKLKSWNFSLGSVTEAIKKF